MAKAVNVTKYDAGGSGDNIIPDGFIKTTEKVWLDSFVFSSASTIGVGMIIDIAKIPAGKKVTGIEIYGLDAASISATSTNAISIGARFGTGSVTNATMFLGATTLGTVSFNNFPVVARSGINQELTNSTHTIYLHVTGASPSITGGTLYTKVRYT